MNNDTQTTVAGLITGIAALIGIIQAGNFSWWSIITGILTGGASAWLGWKTNKQEKNITPQVIPLGGLNATTTPSPSSVATVTSMADPKVQQPAG